jgi:prepilin-type N-terminal cleavage/methylation domain-containing protein
MTNGDRPRAGIRELVIDSSFVIRPSSFRATRGFTVVEILVVMTIILVLAGLVLATSSYVHNKGARSRAEAEIAAMSAALENYKADNGVYPTSSLILTSTTAADYTGASKLLYRALVGDTDTDGQPGPGTSYMAFKPNQLGGTGTDTFVKDPFGNSYGYSTVGPTGGGNNPTFDLWSIADGMVGAIQTKWIKNW